MITRIREYGIRNWGLWVTVPLEDIISYYEDEPVMVGSTAEAEFLRGYALIIGKELKDLSVFNPITDLGVYISARGYQQIKIHIHLELNQ